MPNQEHSGLASGVSLLCITIFCGVLFVAWDLYRKRHILKFSSTLNGYRFFPIIGNAHHLRGTDGISIWRIFEKKFSLRGGLWVGHNFTYMTADPEEIKAILNHQHSFDKHHVYKTFDKFIGDTILMAKFDRWKSNRKVLVKCFSTPNLQSYIDIIYERASIFAEKLKESQSVDAKEVFERLSLNIFSATLLGLNSDEAKINELLEGLRSGEKFLQSRALTSYFYPDFIAYLFPGGKQILIKLRRLKKIVSEVLQERRKAPRDKEFDDDQKSTIADVLIEGEGTLFVEDELFREVLQFVGGATETSGGTLAFTFTLLGMNPHIQEKVYHEVETIVGDNGPISYNDLSKLKYTERAIRETMRLLPVVPLLGRHATADVDLGTRTIPAGTDILMGIMAMHRSETYWPNPLEYNPDRFLPEEVAKRHPYSYIPFSGGSRNCIGMKYAMLLMKMVVANVIRNYHVTSNYKSIEDLELTSAIMMSATHKLDCVFTPRIR